MTLPQQLVTDRLILRRWRESDLPVFAAYNRDPRVMQHFPRSLSRAESDAFAARIEAGFSENGFGLWAVEIPGASPFAGYVGLHVPRWKAPFLPAVEVGWRLGCAAWGRGLAAEAARAALDDGFGRVGLSSVVSMTIPANRRSIRLMERLGMMRDPAADFDHPEIDGGRYRRHVLYRLDASRFYHEVE